MSLPPEVLREVLRCRDEHIHDSYAPRPGEVAWNFNGEGKTVCAAFGTLRFSVGAGHRGDYSFCHVWVLFNKDCFMVSETGHINTTIPNSYETLDAAMLAAEEWLRSKDTEKSILRKHYEESVGLR